MATKGKGSIHQAKVGAGEMDIRNDAVKAVEIIGKPEIVAKELAQFNLLRNPFPEKAQVGDVFICQDAVKEKFYQQLGGFRSGRSTALRVQGNPGGGKSAFLNWAKSLITELRRRKVLDFIYPVQVMDPSPDFMDFFSEVMDQVSASFLDRLIAHVQDNPSALDKLEGIDNLNLLTVFRDIAKGSLAGGGQMILPLEPIIAREVEHKSLVLQKWLRGDKLTKLSAQDRKALGLVAELDTPAIATKYFRDFMQVLMGLGICKGIVILFDEFEVLLSRSVSPMKRAQYFQDLRHFVDHADKGVFLVVASSPFAESEIAESRPLFRRLGAPVELETIANEKDALEYAFAYIKDARGEYEREYPNDRERKLERYAPLSEDSIVRIYGDLRAKYTEIVPGYFLPALLEEVNRVLFSR